MAAQDSSATAQWRGTGHLAVVHNTGTIDFTSLGVQHDLQFTQRRFRGDLQTNVHYARTATSIADPMSPGVTTQRVTRVETYAASARGRYAMGGAAHVTLRSGWTRDPSNGLGHRLQAFGGVGLESGGGGPSTATIDLTGGVVYEADVDSDAMTFAALSTTVGWNRRMGDAGTVAVTAHVIENLDDLGDFLVTAGVRVTGRISSRFGVSLGYDVTWDGEPSDVLLDPTAEGITSTPPVKLRTGLQASLTVQW